MINVKEAQKVCNITGLVIRYKNIFDTLKAVALAGTQSKLTETEYDDIFFVICRDRNDNYFKGHRQQFLEMSLRDWPEKIEKLKLTAHVQDVCSVPEYIRLFNKQYNETVDGWDMRGNETISVRLGEAINGPNNHQMAVS